MCGRFLLSVDIEELLERYRIIKGWSGGVNTGQEIFPTNNVPIITAKRELMSMKWGFAAPYTKGPIINARGETVDEKPLFRKSLEKRRCIIPANAFFEWMKVGKSSTKYKIIMEDQPIFSMAGLYDNFLDKDGNSYAGFTIITTTPNASISKIHNRMPVILPPEDEDKWLDPELNDGALIKAFIKPYDKEHKKLRIIAV